MRRQTTTTTEGVGNGAVERYIPRIKNNQVRIENIVNLNEIVERIEIPPLDRIDGGVISAMAALSEEDIKTILKAAEILKGMK
jgi:hypothetical protein